MVSGPWGCVNETPPISSSAPNPGVHPGDSGGLAVWLGRHTSEKISGVP